MKNNTVGDRWEKWQGACNLGPNAKFLCLLKALGP